MKIWRRWKARTEANSCYALRMVEEVREREREGVVAKETYGFVGDDAELAGGDATPDEFESSVAGGYSSS